MMKRLLVMLIISAFLSSCSNRSCGGDLGNNLFLLEGDNINDRIIVYCSRKSSGCCNSGIYVIPTYENHMRNGKYAEYVDGAKSNNKWIIVKSLVIGSQDERYWIMNKDFKLNNVNCDNMNCDSILQSNVKGPFDINGFNEIKRELKINLAF